MKAFLTLAVSTFFLAAAMSLPSEAQSPPPPPNPSICPPVGADTGCAAIITISPTNSSITFTGQGPYDTIEDTLIGVVNASKAPILAIGLRSSMPIFGFDGDGICGISPVTNQPYNPAPVGCPFGPTGYEGPGVTFSNISSDQLTGAVSFNPPLAVGATAYFSLEENINSAFSCPDVVNHALGTVVSDFAITATFVPNLQLTMQQAAQLCGFTNFDWQQTITSYPAPSGVFQIGNPVALTAPPPYLDPPPGGYTYEFGGDQSYPFFYNPNNGELASHESTYSVGFYDDPQDQCLPGGNSDNVKGCMGAHAPAGSFLGFTTHLVGILPNGNPLDLGVGWTWTSTYNGTSGGVSTTKNNLPMDPGSGTGKVTVTGSSDVTWYQYNGIAVTTVNGTPIGLPTPVVTIAANPQAFAPPALGKTVAVTVSGTITEATYGSPGLNAGTAGYYVTDEYGLYQPHGNVTLGSNGSYSFILNLPDSLSPNYVDRVYTITVSALDNAGTSGSGSTKVTVVPVKNGP